MSGPSSTFASLRNSFLTGLALLAPLAPLPHASRVARLVLAGATPPEGDALLAPCPLWGKCNEGPNI